MRRVLTLACVALTLPGCALLPRKVEVRYVSTYCLTQQQYQQLKAESPPLIHPQMNGDEDHDIKIMAGSLVRVRAYADGLLEVIGGCTEPDAHKIADKLLDDAK